MIDKMYMIKKNPVNLVNPVQAGAGSTLAAAEAIGYESIGVEKDEYYFEMTCKAIPKLIRLKS
jgi:DNA modification methylase